MSHFGDSEFPGSDPSHQGSEDKMVGGPRSSRGAWSNPGAEHQIQLAALREKSSGSTPATAPVPGATSTSKVAPVIKPEMNFDDVARDPQDSEGDVDDGDQKRVQKRTPATDILDEPTVVGPAGYHHGVMASVPPDHGPESLVPSTLMEPATARKGGGITKK